MRYLMFGITVFALSLAAVAGTTVSGAVSGNWTSEGSPYQVTGDLTVARGSTLWIEPGVDVIFNGPYSVQVEGRLVAGRKKGLHLKRSGDPVHFTTDLNQNAEGWAGIRFAKAGDENELTNCTIEHVRSTVDGGGVRIERSEVTLTNCDLLDCATTGAGGAVAVFNGGVVLTNCTMENNRAEQQGGAIYGEDAEIVSTNCDLKKNTGSAGGAVYATKTELVSTNDSFDDNSVGNVNLLGKSEGVFTNSSLTGGGMVCSDSELTLTNVHIESPDNTALSFLDHSSALITNATLRGMKGMEKDETSKVIATNVDY